MKHILLTITLSTIIISSAVAGHSERRGEVRQQRMVQKLGLTAEQQQSFEIIMQEKHDNLKAAKQQIDQETNAKLASILSEEQMLMLEETKHMKKVRKQHRKMHKR